MYLRRKIDSYLKKWKEDPEHKPLNIKGARQVGKTESILQFARGVFLLPTENYVFSYIDTSTNSIYNLR